MTQAIGPGEGEVRRLLLLQARYVLRDLHAKYGDSAYGKMAAACEEAAFLLAEEALTTPAKQQVSA